MPEEDDLQPTQGRTTPGLYNQYLQHNEPAFWQPVLGAGQAFRYNTIPREALPNEQGRIIPAQVAPPPITPYVTYDDFRNDYEPRQPYILDENTRDWLPQELKKKKQTVKEILTEKPVLDIIEDISAELIEEEVAKLKRIYQIKLDTLAVQDYNELLQAGHNIQDDESIIYYNFQRYALSFTRLKSSDILQSDKDSFYLTSVESKAKIRYHKDYSKYKFYPRLKAKVEYGDGELLSKIMAITQIGKGRVVCK